MVRREDCPFASKAGEEAGTRVYNTEAWAGGRTQTEVSCVDIIEVI